MSCSSEFRRRVISSAVIGSSLALFVPGASGKLLAHGAHIHGQAELYLALNAPNEMIVEWKSPAGDIFGFETLGDNKERRTKVQERLSGLKNPERLLRLPGDKGCSYETQKLAAFGEDLLMFSPAGDTAKQKNPTKDRKSPQSEHSDLQATYQVRCQNPIAGQKISLSIIEAFPRIKSLSVIFLGDQGQKKWDVRSARYEISL